MITELLLSVAVATIAPDRYIVEVPAGFAPPVVRILPGAAMVPGDRARVIKCDGIDSVMMGADGRMQMDCGDKIEYEVTE